MKYNSIVISGVPGCGKTVLARLLSSKLNWEICPLGTIWRNRHKDQRPDISFEEYWRQTTLEENAKVNEEVKASVEQGQRIAELRYVHIYGLKTLKIFITSPIDTRVPRVMNRYPGKMPLEVKDIITAREADEVGMGKKLFGEGYDHRDPKHYDLVLDSSKMSIEQEVNLALQALQA